MNRTNHAHINRMLTLLESESQPFRKVHRLIDTFETILKTYTAVIIAALFKEIDIPEKLKGLLAEALQTPSLGTWQYISIEIVKAMKEHNIPFAIDKFAETFEDYDKKYCRNIDEKKGFVNLISLRNGYAHGATPSDEECLKDIEKNLPKLYEIISAEWFNETAIVAFNKSGDLNTPIAIDGDTCLSDNDNSDCKELNEALNKASANKEIKPNYAYLITKTGDIINLFPILTVTAHESADAGYSLTFFNDLRKKNSLSLLNYPNSKHSADKNLYTEFLSMVPLNEWKKSSTVSLFKERIEELTESFKGRRKELSVLKIFISERSNGHFFIWGNPGVGKSALTARAVQELSWENFPVDSEIVGEERLKVDVVEYFIRRNMQTDEEIYYINAIGKSIESKYKTGIPIGNTPVDMTDNYYQRLTALSGMLVDKNKKMVLIIDGIDEAKDELVKRLPMENYQNIVTIFSSRDVIRARDVYRSLNAEHRSDMTIGGLNIEDIRALLYESADKYSIQKEYLEKISERSEGNPLYLKLLCNALLIEEIALNDISALPKEIGVFYDTIIKRFSNLPNGDKIVELLYLLAVTMDYLHADTVSSMLGVNRITADRIIEEAAEVLFENPLTGNYDDWQLFHESFRDYLCIKYPADINRFEKRVLDICSTWQILKDGGDKFTAMYVFNHYIPHLQRIAVRDEVKTAPFNARESKHKSLIYDLVLNKEYIEAQLKILKFHDAVLRDAETALQFIVRDTAGKPCENIENKKIIETGNLPLLCALTLNAGEAGYKAQNDISIAFDWAREGKIEDAVKRLCVINDENRLFKTFFLLLWVTTDSDLSDDIKKKNIEFVMKAIDDKIPKGTGVVDWGKWGFSDLISKVIIDILKYSENLISLYNRGKDDVVKKTLFVYMVKSATDLVDKEKCLSFIKQAYALAMTITDPIYKFNILGEIALDFDIHGDKETSEKVFIQILSDACTIDHDMKKSDVIINIAKYIAVSNLQNKKILLEKAFKTTETIAENIEAKTRAHRAIEQIIADPTCCTIEVDSDSNNQDEKNIFTTADFEHDIDKIIAMRIPKNKKDALCKIAQCLSKLGIHDKAEMVLNSDLITSECINNHIESSDKTILTNVHFNSTELVDSTDDVNQNNEILRCFAENLAVTGFKEENAKIYEQLFHTISDIDDNITKSQLLRNVAETVSELGDSQKSEVIFDKIIVSVSTIDDYEVKSKLLGEIALEIIKSGDITKSLQVFDQALDYTSCIKDATKKSLIFSNIAESIALSGNAEKAQYVFMKAIDFAGTIKGQTKYQVSAKIAKSIALYGNIEQALAYLDTFQYAKYKSPAYSEIAIRIARSGEIEKAISFVDNIDDPVYQSRALIEIAQYVSTSTLDNTELLLESILKSSCKINDIDKKFITQGEVATCMAHSGNFVRSLSIVGAIVKEDIKIHSLNSISRSITFSGSSNWNILENWFETVESIEYKALKALIESWTNGLSDYAVNKQKTDDTTYVISYLLRSFLWLPLDGECASHVVFSLLSLLAGLDRLDYIKTISSACQQLGLENIFANDTTGLSEEITAELAKLDRLLAEDEITKKGYEKRKAEILSGIDN